MEAAFELSVTAQLDEDDFVEQEAYKVERLAGGVAR